MNAKEIIDEAISLPVEERAIVVDSILKSLNPPDSVVDKKWAQVAKKRLNEIRKGQAKMVPGDEVFAKIWKRLGK